MNATSERSRTRDAYPPTRVHSRIPGGYAIPDGYPRYPGTGYPPFRGYPTRTRTCLATLLPEPSASAIAPRFPSVAAVDLRPADHRSDDDRAPQFPISHETRLPEASRHSTHVWVPASASMAAARSTTSGGKPFGRHDLSAVNESSIPANWSLPSKKSVPVGSSLQRLSVPSYSQNCRNDRAARSSNWHTADGSTCEVRFPCSRTCSRPSYTTSPLPWIVTRYTGQAPWQSSRLRVSFACCHRLQSAGCAVVDAEADATGARCGAPDVGATDRPGVGEQADSAAARRRVRTSPAYRAPRDPAATRSARSATSCASALEQRAGCRVRRRIEDSRSNRIAATTASCRDARRPGGAR